VTCDNRPMALACTPLLAALLAASVAATTAGEQQPAVTTRLAPPVFRVLSWDPANPGPDIPTERRDRDAFTDVRYRCSAHVRVRAVGETDDGASLHLVVEVTGVDLTLSLDETVYLPPSPTDRLRAHEDGHRLIAESLFSGGEARARELAGPWIGRRLTADSASAEEAAKDATKRAARLIGQSWVDAMLADAARLQDRYDSLTDHGLYESPTAQEAVAQVLQDATRR